MVTVVLVRVLESRSNSTKICGPITAIHYRPSLRLVAEAMPSINNKPDILQRRQAIGYRVQDFEMMTFFNTQRADCQSVSRLAPAAVTPQLGGFRDALASRKTARYTYESISDLNPAETDRNCPESRVFAAESGQIGHATLDATSIILTDDTVSLPADNDNVPSIPEPKASKGDEDRRCGSQTRTTKKAKAPKPKRRKVRDKRLCRETTRIDRSQYDDAARAYEVMKFLCRQNPMLRPFLVTVKPESLDAASLDERHGWFQDLRRRMSNWHNDNFKIDGERQPIRIIASQECRPVSNRGYHIHGLVLLPINDNLPDGTRADDKLKAALTRWYPDASVNVEKASFDPYILDSGHVGDAFTYVTKATPVEYTNRWPGKTNPSLRPWLPWRSNGKIKGANLWVSKGSLLRPDLLKQAHAKAAVERSRRHASDVWQSRRTIYLRAIAS